MIMKTSSLHISLFNFVSKYKRTQNDFDSRCAKRPTIISGNVNFYNMSLFTYCLLGVINLEKKYKGYYVGEIDGN